MSSPKSKGSIRTIPIVESLEPVLAVHKQRQEAEKTLAGSAWNPDNLVFCSTVGTFIEARNINRELKKICEYAGIEPFTMHTLRHSFASRLIEAGVHIKYIQGYLGHADASLTLNTYSHIAPAIAHSQIKKIDGTIAIDPKTEAKFRRSFQPHNSRKKTQQPKIDLTSSLLMAIC